MSNPLKCFVIMPFTPQEVFDKVYFQGIFPASKIGALPVLMERLDTTPGVPSPMLRPNLRALLRGADFFVADLTSLKPNVLYEIGYAEALAKPVVYIIKKEELPMLFTLASDLCGIQPITYEMGSLNVLAQELAFRLKPIVEHLSIAPSASWEKICQMVLRAVEIISNDTFGSPDLVIGVGRGGSILGAMVAGNLGHVPFYALDRAYPVEKGKRQRILVEHGTIDLSPYKSIWVIVSESVGGGTVQMVRDWLQAKNAERGKILVFFNAAGRSPAADHIVEHFDYSGRSMTEPWYLSPTWQPWHE